jgi:hypothetical protein
MDDLVLETRGLLDCHIGLPRNSRIFLSGHLFETALLPWVASRRTNSRCTQHKQN